MPSTVVIGVGNPLVSDDGVGPRVARGVAEATAARGEAVDVRELFVGGMALMEALVGYRRAIVVDATVSGQPAGTVRRLAPEDLPESWNSTCAHDTTLTTALALGRELRLPLPEEIEIWGIEAADLTTFGERLTDAVERAVPVAVARIVASLAAAGERGGPR